MVKRIGDFSNGSISSHTFWFCDFHRIAEHRRSRCAHQGICPSGRWNNRSCYAYCILWGVVLLTASSCGIGDVGTSRTEVSSSSATDNSTDNSLHGISQCTAGSTLVCTPEGPKQVSISEECINANGEPVTLQGPDIVSAAQAATVCPTPEPAPEVITETASETPVATVPVVQGI